MNEQIVHFGDNLHFDFDFSPDRRTLKFLKVKCNPTNKKRWPTLCNATINNNL